MVYLVDHPLWDEDFVPDNYSFETAPLHSLEAFVSIHFVGTMHIHSFYNLVASALEEYALVDSALEDETHRLSYGRVIRILASLIAVHPRSPISVFTPTLFDSILAEWGDDGTRSGCIIQLAQVLDYAFFSDLVDSGYAQRAVDAARHAALELKEEAFVAARDEQTRRDARGGDGAWAEVPFSGTTHGHEEKSRSAVEADRANTAAGTDQKEAEAKAKQEVGARAQKEADGATRAAASKHRVIEEEQRREAETQAQKEAEAKAKKEAEARAKKEADEETRATATKSRALKAKRRREAKAKAQKEPEAKAKKEAESRATKEADAEPKVKQTASGEDQSGAGKPKVKHTASENTPDKAKATVKCATSGEDKAVVTSAVVARDHVDAHRDREVQAGDCGTCECPSGTADAYGPGDGRPGVGQVGVRGHVDDHRDRVVKAGDCGTCECLTGTTYAYGPGDGGVASDEGKSKVQRAGDQETTGKPESTSSKDKPKVTSAVPDKGNLKGPHAVSDAAVVEAPSATSGADKSMVTIAVSDARPDTPKTGDQESTGKAESKVPCASSKTTDNDPTFHKGTVAVMAPAKGYDLGSSAALSA